MTKSLILQILTLLIVCSCNQEFKHNPSEPYPELRKGEYWIDKFDQRGLQNAVSFEDRLYVNTINISEGDDFIYCLNLEDGKVQWKYKVKTYASQPVSITKNRIYYCTYIGDIYAFTKEGKLLWINKLKSSYGGHRINQLNNNLIVRSVSNGLYEFDSSSGELIKHYEKGKGSTLPIIVNNKMIYSIYEYRSNPNNLLKCIDYKTKQLDWEISTDTQLEKIILTKEGIIAHDRFSGIYCFDSTNGKIKWSQKFKRKGFNSSINCSLVNNELISYNAYEEKGFLDIRTGKKVEFKFDGLRQKYNIKKQNENYQIDINELLNSRNKTEIKIKKTTGNNV